MPKQIEEIIGETRKMPERLEMPGNPRYQPNSLKPYFGYDNIARFYFEVEWGLLNVLAKLGVIPAGTETLLTEDVYRTLRQRITTTLEDKVEREITKHDIRALLAIIRYSLERTPGLKAKGLAKWFHIPATSYDTIDSARILAYKRAFWEVSFPALLDLIAALKIKAAKFSDTLQIGRTHGQHAEPITVGFWLATILARIIDIADHLVDRERELMGKFSGPVGAYNCQVTLGFEAKARAMFGKTFEEMVLEELGLLVGPISTQILLPEPLARFLFEFTLLSGALGQLSRDCRNLQRSEIAETEELFEKNQDGSSAMPHKRNPITWEGVEGIYTIVRNEFHKVLDVIITDHQRDATNMCVMREFPGVVVLTQHQLETVNKALPNLSVDELALERNFAINRNVIMSEAVYIALVMAGYDGDAHNLVNHTLVPRSKAKGKLLIEELISLSAENPELGLDKVLKNMPSEVGSLFYRPDLFTGKAKEKTLKAVQMADDFLKKYERR